jgi:hypothetical protein
VALRHWETDRFDPLAFKLPRIETIARSLPGHELVLVGDTGEKDPEVFAEIGARLGRRVRLVLLRRSEEETADAPRWRGAFAFARASQAACEAARLGLIAAGDVLEVARAEAGLKTR